MRIAVAKSDSRDARKECLNSAMITLEMSPYLNLIDSVCRAKGTIQIQQAKNLPYHVILVNFCQK